MSAGGQELRGLRLQTSFFPVSFPLPSFPTLPSSFSMVPSIQQNRSAELEAYLTNISKRSFKNLIEDYPRSDTTIQQRWRNLFLGWKIEMRVSLLKYLSDNQAWRRIQYLFEEILYFLEAGRPVSPPHSGHDETKLTDWIWTGLERRRNRCLFRNVTFDGPRTHQQSSFLPLPILDLDVSPDKINL